MPETSSEYAKRTHLKYEGAGPDTLQAISGRLIHLENPGRSELAVSDIAHGLAHTCRFGGQCERFYSVAQHAVFVRDLVAADESSTLQDVRAAVHHDDAEAFLGDVPSPLKPLLGEPWEKLETSWNKRICKLLGLPEGIFSTDAIKKWDEFAVYYEAAYLMPNEGWDWTRDMNLELPEEVFWDVPLGPRASKELYIHAVEQEGRMGLQE